MSLDTKFRILMTAYAVVAASVLTGIAVRGCTESENARALDEERRARCARIVDVYPSGWFCAEFR